MSDIGTLSFKSKTLIELSCWWQVVRPDVAEKAGPKRMWQVREFGE